MALEFLDAVQYTTVTQAAQVYTAISEIITTYSPWSLYGQTVLLNLATGRFSGTQAFAISTQRSDSCGTAYIALSNQVTRYASASYYVLTAALGTGFPIMAFSDAGLVQIAFLINSSGYAVITRSGAATLATGTVAITANTWHRFEFMVTVDSISGYVEMRVDGVTVVSYTGNTQYTANAYSNQVHFCNATSGNSSSPVVVNYITDAMVYTATGASPNTWLGDKRFYTQYANADGSATAWTANWASFTNSTVYVLGQQLLDGNGNVQQCTTPGTSQASGTPTWATLTGATTTSSGAVFTCKGAAAKYKAANENPMDGDNSYLSDATVNDEEGFLFPALPGTATNIVGVGIVAWARKDDAGTRSTRLEVKSGTSIVDNGSDFIQTMSYAYQQGFFPTDPQTSGNWTVAGVNALEARIKTTA